MASVDERELVKAAKAGNSHAFDELTRRYMKKAYSVALQMVRDQEDAKDLVQDALFEAYRAIPGFKIQYRFSTWFYRILINKCINHQKRLARRRTFSFSALLHPWDDQVPWKVQESQHITTQTPQHILEEEEIRQAVLDALDALSEKHRMVVVLFDLEGFSHQQIAAILQCPEGTVMSRLHYARGKLQKLLSRRLPGYFDER